MGASWIRNIRRSKTLHVYQDPLLSSSRWAKIFKPGIDECNRLYKSKNLGITFRVSGSVPTARGGANVWVRVAQSSINLQYKNVNKKTPFNGRYLHGYTALLSGETTHEIEKAYIFLPADPHISTNTPSGPLYRKVGEGVMKVIFVHELIHACGLHNSDHTNDDIFKGRPNVDYGSTPQGDKVVVGGRKMPPLYLSAATVSKIKSLW
jgi:hypothetical protein